MPRVPIVLLFVLVGCADAPLPRWQATHEACAWTPREWTLSDYAHVWLDDVYPDEACVDRVLADFAVDTEAFLEADALHDPYGVVRDEDGVWGTRLGGLLSAAWALHAFDWGNVGEVRAGALVDPAFSARLAEISAHTGDPEVGAALYDYATASLVETVPGTGGGDAATWHEGRLTLFVPLTGVTGAAILAHEARHGDGRRHRRCDDGEAACDADLEGAYGFQIATVAIALERTSDPDVEEHLAVHLDHALEHVTP